MVQKLLSKLGVGVPRAVAEPSATQLISRLSRGDAGATVGSHRGFSQFELQYCRRVDGYEFKVEDSPGCRVEPGLFALEHGGPSISEDDDGANRGVSGIWDRFATRDNLYKIAMDARLASTTSDMSILIEVV